MKSGTILSVLIALLLTTGIVLAQTGHDYRLTWSSLDGGGATFSSDGQYSLGGTIGQPDAGMLTRGKYTLVSGFWGAAGLMAPVASIDFIQPDPAVQGLDLVYFQATSQDNDQGGAYIAAYLWTSSVDGILSEQEDSTVPASELSAGSHTVTFQVQDNEGEWSVAATGTLTVLPGEAGVRTLILGNRAKLAALYGATKASQVMDKLDDLAAHDRVQGLVVQVEDAAAVAAAYVTWDADPTSTAKANAVTEAIKGVVDAQWAAHPDLEYLVIAGDDRVIPFRRVPNQAYRWGGRWYGREQDYPYVSASSTVGSALRAEMTLTDDYYADAVPTIPGSAGWDGHDLYIPDLGTGRLIETPEEIIAQIDAFLAGNLVAADEAIVTAYDFMKDSAQAMCDELTADGLAADCTLIGEGWGRQGYIRRVLNRRHAVVSINGHAWHAGMGSPGDGVSSGDVAGAEADHARAVFYTLGCHSGLNVPPTNPREPLDTAQALVQHRANYIANTGYGWGSLSGVALSEQLMLDLTERLVYGRDSTLGQALAAAKQEYYLNDGNFGYYDEKILIESTLYGLPMYRYTTPVVTGARGPGVEVIEQQQFRELGNGLTANSIRYQFPPLTAESTADGVYYTLGGLAQMNHGQPIQPMYTPDLSFPGTTAHGVVFKGGDYADEAAFDPVVDQAINEYVPAEEPSFEAPGWVPALPLRLNSLERGDRGVTFLGQFHAPSQTERLYDEFSLDVYYHATSEDWTPPAITGVAGTVLLDTATVQVQASDSSGIHTVVVAYTDGGGSWQSTDLTTTGSVWSGSFTADAGTRFLVQVVDSAGNVAAEHNEGQYFPLEVVEPNYGVEVTPAVQTRAGQPGVTVAYTLQVRCIGNVADTYDVAVSGNAWPAHAPATVGPLAAGEGQAMEVTVEIPGAAAYGASDTATINVTSQGDAAQSASATLTTIVRPAELFLPLILK